MYSILNVVMMNEIYIYQLYQIIKLVHFGKMRNFGVKTEMR